MKPFYVKLLISIVILAISADLVWLHLKLREQNRLAYIDTARLLDGYQGMKDARAAYQQKAAQWQANIDTLQQEVTSSIMDYEKTAPGMTAKERQLTEELIRTKQKQFQDYQRAIQQQAQQEDEKMTQQVVERVNGFLKDYGKRSKYKVIFGTAQGNILYAVDSYDITTEVLTELNLNYSK